MSSTALIAELNEVIATLEAVQYHRHMTRLEWDYIENAINIILKTIAYLGETE